jgi:thiamine kinase-like enzyme
MLKRVLPLALLLSLSPVWATDLDACRLRIRSMLQFREDRLTWLLSDGTNVLRTGQVVTFHGETYTVRGFLGSSTAQVYLADTASGQKVVLKMATEPNLALYETRITEFLREQGLDVPRVLWSDVNRGVVIKEYVQGITMDELKDLRNKNQLHQVGLEVHDFDELLKRLVKNQQEWVKKTSRFYSWFKKKYPQDFQLISSTGLSYLLTIGDIKDVNVIYSPIKDKWILFDP